MVAALPFDAAASAASIRRGRQAASGAAARPHHARGEAEPYTALVAPPADEIRYFANEGEPALREPCAILAFGGWLDAGSAGTGAVQHLVASLPTRKLADIDPEEFYNFTDTRPLTSIVAPGERAVHWPRGEFHGAVMSADSDRDVVLFAAPEPNLRWHTFATAVLDALEREQVTSLITIGSIFGAVHHRAQVPMTGWATDVALRQELLRRNITFTNYEGPTGFVTVLLAEAQARNLPAAAIMGLASNYIQGVPNPRVSLALLRAVASITGLPFQLTELERSGRALVRQVDKLLADQPELREQVDRMLSLMNVSEPSSQTEDEPPTQASSESAASEPAVELPSPQAVVAELEEFLKQLRERDGGPSTN
jgi:proteasome assembly chaperone (PAC2) family protein